MWSTIDKYLHPGLDADTARFILKYTNDEFCVMFQEEMEVRKNYTGRHWLPFLDFKQSKCVLFFSRTKAVCVFGEVW